MEKITRILIVEDTLSDAEFAQRQIKRSLSPCEFRRVDTQEDFLEALETFHPDLIISDYSMPRFNGLAALKLALKYSPLTPVIILTGAINEDTAVECMKAGAADYVIKEHLKRLGQAVIRALEEKEVRRQRRVAEENLRIGEERYRIISHLISDFMYAIRIEPDGSLILEWGDDTFSMMTGFQISPDDHMVEVIGEIFHPDDVKIARLHWEKIFSGKTDDIEYRIYTKENELRWMRNFGQPIWNAEGSHIVRIIGASQDISERKQAEDALRQSEARYRSRTQELEVLFNLSNQFRESQTTGEILSIITTQIPKIIPQDGCAVLGYNDDERSYTVLSASGSINLHPGLIFPELQGMDQKLVRSGQPLLFDDYSLDPRRINYPGHGDQFGPGLFVPLQIEDFFLGWFITFREKSPSVRPFNNDEIRLLDAVLGIASNAFHRAQLFEEIQGHLHRTEALQDIQLTVASSFDEQTTLNVALEHVKNQLNVDAAAILLLNPHTLELEFRAMVGFQTIYFERNRIRLGDSISGKVALDRKPIYIDDLNQVQNSPNFIAFCLKEGFQAFYSAPLISKGQVKGVLEIFNRTPLHINKEWTSFLTTLASQLAMAVDNLMLFSDLQVSNLKLALAYDATIEGLSRALDLRDKETNYHTRRVTHLVMRMARIAGIGESDLKQIQRGALLHDVGKVGIPDSILLKPGKLTDEEWDIMRKHPRYAYEIFSSIDYLRPALDIPYCHHEKWDGTGYPRGLKGEDIPLAARLFSIVDVWDALTSERPYRQAWTREDTLAYIKEQSGKQFDPRIVDIFIKVIAEENGE